MVVLRYVGSGYKINQKNLVMQIYDVLKISSPQIELLGRVGINPDYCHYLPLFEDYMAMRNMGGKITYIVAKLAEDYDVSVRTVYDVVRRMQCECNPFAVD